LGSQVNQDLRLDLVKYVIDFLIAEIRNKQLGFALQVTAVSGGLYWLPFASNFIFRPL
jgi:hypothetical protein